MPTTNPRQGATRARAIAALATLALTGAAHAGTQQFTRWIGPVDGSFLDPANWDTGALPTAAMPALIDAVGKPYTVTFNTAARMFPLLLDSDDATVLFSVREISSSPPLTNAPLTVRRGELRLSSNAQTRDLSAITIEQHGRFHVEGPPTSSSGLVRIGRDLTLDGTGRVDRRTNLVFAPDLTLSGFAIPRVNIGETGSLTLQGQNILFGGVITNRGTLHILNDLTTPSHLNTVRIGENTQANNPNQQTVFNNRGLVTVDHGSLILDSTGAHTGEFHLAENSRLEIATAQTFLSGSRITGPGLTVADRGELFISPVTIESNLRVNRGGVFGGALTIGGRLELLASNQPLDVEFLAPVTVGEAVLAWDRNLVFRDAFDGAFSVSGTASIPRSVEIYGPATIRGDMRPMERATFHSTAHIQGDALNVTLNNGGVVDGAFLGNIQLRGTVTAGGNFTQTATQTSLFDRNRSGDAVYFGGSVDIRSTNFESRLPIFATGSFRASAGIYDTITADTVSFDGSGGVGSGSVRIRNFSTITAHSGPVLINRAEVSLHPRGNAPFKSLFFATFASGFEITFVPLTPATRSGFRLLIDADTLSNEQIRFGADSLLAGTLDIRLRGDAANLTFGDTFTLFAATTASNATLTGEFDRLFLPTLTNGLSLELLYDAHSLTLRVIPTPAAAPILALAGLAATRRRSR